jgi:hypothetical protein
LRKTIGRAIYDTPVLNPDLLDLHLNNFALCCFRDIADGDYITARMAFRAGLIPQALWSSEQAIEKYVCILLLQRVEANTRVTRLPGFSKSLRRNSLTGFSNGVFDARAVHEHSSFDFLYHLHGSVHFSLRPV